MKPFAIDSMVAFQGNLYFVEAVLEEGPDPLYRLRRTALKHLPSPRTTARHSELTIRGGVLN